MGYWKEGQQRGYGKIIYADGFDQEGLMEGGQFKPDKSQIKTFNPNTQIIASAIDFPKYIKMPPPSIKIFENMVKTLDEEREKVEDEHLKKEAAKQQGEADAKPKSESKDSSKTKPKEDTMKVNEKSNTQKKAKKKSETKPILGYWDIRGFAANIRF